MRRASFAVALVGLALAACSSKPKSPEDQVRKQIAKWEEAAEEHDVDVLREGISDAYQDDRDNNHRAIRSMLGMHFMRNQNVHVITRITSLSFPREKRARVRVAAGLAARKVSDPSELMGAQAAIYVITLDLEDEDDGDWKVRSARWERGGPGDFVE